MNSILRLRYLHLNYLIIVRIKFEKFNFLDNDILINYILF